MCKIEYHDSRVILQGSVCAIIDLNYKVEHGKEQRIKSNFLCSEPLKVFDVFLSKTDFSFQKKLLLLLLQTHNTHKTLQQT